MGVRAAELVAGHPARVVALGDPALGQPARTALYWFQSPSRITGDYATRIAADLSPDKARWAMVAVLFDTAADPASPAVRALAAALREAVHAILDPSAPPGGPS